MPRRQITSKLGALILVISLALLQGSARSWRRMKAKASSSILNKLARPSVRLSIHPSTGLTVSDSSNGRDIVRVQGPLIAVGGKSLRGLSLRQIECLLRGPLNSEVELSFFNQYKEVQSVKLKRISRTRYGLSRPEDMHASVYQLEDENSVNWTDSYSHQFSDLEANNLELFERANENFTLSKLFSLPDPKGKAIYQITAETLMASDTIGALDTSNYCLNLISKYQEFDLLNYEIDNSKQGKLISHLIDTGRFALAETYCKDLINYAESPKGKSDGWSSQQSVNSLRRLLASSQIQRSYKEPAAAKEANETLLKNTVGISGSTR